VSRIFWDTNLFVYLFEDYGRLSQMTVELREKMLLRGDQLLTSTITLGEILVKPLRLGDLDLCKKYEETINSVAIILPFDMKAARLYAAIRIDKALRAPDVVQLSCAGSSNTDLFITNDNRLHGKHVKGIQFIVPLALAPV
jgi:predicted nucleic acid-binding protein